MVIDLGTGWRAAKSRYDGNKDILALEIVNLASPVARKRCPSLLLKLSVSNAWAESKFSGMTFGKGIVSSPGFPGCWVAKTS